MASSAHPPVNFSIAPSAHREIARLRRIWDARCPDRADVLVVGWGTTRLDTGEQSSGVIVSFYGRSERSGIQDAIQVLSGHEVVFFVTEEHHPRFDGKIVDFSEDRGFFLRA